MKILIIKRDKIGDLLLTTPMLRHLRLSLPDAHIHLLANDYNAWVVAGNKDINKIWVYPRTKLGKRIRITAIIKQIRLLTRLRRENFDVAIVANGDESPRAVKWGLNVHARRTIAYCSQNKLCTRLSDALPVPNNMHETDRLMGLLEPLGIEPPASAIQPQYILPDHWRRYAATWLNERGLAPTGYIVLGLGARRAKKQPTPAQIIRWSAYVKRRYNLNAVFMWTPGKSENPLYPGDDEIAQAVIESKPPHIHPFRGPLLPAIGLIWQARTSIMPDSGLMHFAAASPGGVLGLFAETDVSPSPMQWGPRGKKARYLVAEKSVEELDDAQIYAQLEFLLN